MSAKQTDLISAKLKDKRTRALERETNDLKNELCTMKLIVHILDNIKRVSRDCISYLHQMVDAANRADNCALNRLKTDVRDIENELNLWERKYDMMCSMQTQESLDSSHTNANISVANNSYNNNNNTIANISNSDVMDGYDECYNKTPNKSLNSPRRKSLPRRRIVNDSPVKTPLNYDTSESTIIPDTPSSPLRSDSEAPLKIDIIEPHIQPELIIEELLNYQPLHEALAVNINKRFSDTDSNVQISESNKNSENMDTQDVQISDNAVQEIISNLELAPEYTTLLDMITEKELQNTPYKNIMSSPFATTSSSNSSLNTPKTPQSNATSFQASTSCVVKNLMSDWKTPEKSVTFYASNDTNLTYQTPIRVTPVKLMKTNLTPCKTIFMSDINIVPNNSQNTANVPIIVTENGVNSVRSNGDTYLFKIQPNIRPVPTVYPHSTRFNRNKRIDFSKPASELQVKRPDLIPRKILPKPSTATSAPTTTVIKEVVTNESFECITNANATVVQQPQRKSKFSNHTTVVKSLDFHSVAKDSGNASDNKTDNNRGAKKVRIDIEVTPNNKNRAAQTRSPMVKILRKMNVNKFLEQIHSNDNN